MAGVEIGVIFVNGNPSAGSISVSGTGYCYTNYNLNVLTDNSVTTDYSSNVCTITPNPGFTFSHVVAESDMGSVTLTPGQSKRIDELSVGGNLTITIYFKSDGYTSNYKLKKPATTDYVTIGDINDNMEKIDTQMKANADLIETKQDKLGAGPNITIINNTISAKDTTYDVATQSANGLMSSTDKTKLDGVDSALAGKVSKSGDTMTDSLAFNGVIYPLIIKRPIADGAFPTGTTQSFILFQGNSKNRALIGMGSRKNDNHILLRICDENGNTSSDVQLRYDASTKTSAFFAPTPSDASDNDNKVATTAWVNTASSVMHTTGNEDIAGAKTFTSRIVEQKSSDMGIEMLSTSFDRSATFTSYQRPVQFIARDKNGDSVLLLQTYAESNNRRGLDLMMYDMGGKHCELSLKSDGSKTYATAPATPSDATSNEIATANWSLSKFQRKITYGTGDPPSGGQAGDIYIKI